MNEITETTVQSASSVDFSIWGLFINADFVVQFVILMLLAASVWCWSIIFNKYYLFKKVTAEADQFENSFWTSKSLDDLYDRSAAHLKDPMAAVFGSAMREWRSSQPGQSAAVAGLPQRVERIMQVTVNRELDDLEKHLGFLATVGSTAPFVGLFGTVWGIMNSFTSIAMMKSTNLAVVAPGIAEALFATALGLVAAIPAVIAYNKLSNDLNRYAGRLEGFVQEFSAIIARKIDVRG
ncbi:MAG: protein TolQ [Alphaproteobacteria bacterium]|nr:protein TolQ [Alphaproteobacteria bacterium]